LENVNKDGSSIPLSVIAVMDTWTNNMMGYPVVIVTRNYQTGQALVEQVKNFSNKILFGVTYCGKRVDLIFISNGLFSTS